MRSVKLIDEGTGATSRIRRCQRLGRRRDAKTIVVTSDGAARAKCWSATPSPRPSEDDVSRCARLVRQTFLSGLGHCRQRKRRGLEQHRIVDGLGLARSFIQHIQKPFYRYRPVIGMQEDLRLTPQTYEDNEGGVAATISEALLIQTAR